MLCLSFYISHIWLDAKHQFWQEELDRWHFHSRYLLSSYIKVFYILFDVPGSLKLT